MASPSRGIGRGGRRPGAGRKPGSISRKTKSLIAKAEREGLLMPLDYLLSIMRDPAKPERERCFAAVASAPYCHVRRSAVAILPPPSEMSDEQLDLAIAQAQQHLAGQSEFERYHNLKVRLSNMIEDAARLSTARQMHSMRRCGGPLRRGRSGSPSIRRD
jgi:hypothetical protein